MLSIIIPVYNVKQYLKACVESVVNQTYYDLEIILVDDGSVDGSGELADELAASDSRIKVVHQENGGLSAARNTGMDIMRGDWYFFLDSDDAIHPDTLRVMMETAEKSSAEMVACSFELFMGMKRNFLK